VPVNKGFRAGMREENPRLCNDLRITLCEVEQLQVAKIKVRVNN